jgi:hypothetical protein
MVQEKHVAPLFELFGVLSGYEGSSLKMTYRE